LHASFKALDFAQSGYVNKDDFVNVMFECATGTLLPAQVIAIVNHFAPSEADVNYTFFLQADHMGQDLGPQSKDQVRMKLSQLSEQDRATIEKLRKTAYELTVQGLNLTQTFMKFA